MSNISGTTTNATMGVSMTGLSPGMQPILPSGQVLQPQGMQSMTWPSASQGVQYAPSQTTPSAVYPAMGGIVPSSSYYAAPAPTMSNAMQWPQQQLQQQPLAVSGGPSSASAVPSHPFQLQPPFASMSVSQQLTPIGQPFGTTASSIGFPNSAASTTAVNSNAATSNGASSQNPFDLFN
jgi:hypothetical protein